MRTEPITIEELYANNQVYRYGVLGTSAPLAGATEAMVGMFISEAVQKKLEENPELCERLDKNLAHAVDIVIDDALLKLAGHISSTLNMIEEGEEIPTGEEA